MTKDPTPKSDGLRAMREATRGHLQATADTPIDASAGYIAGAKTIDALAPPKKKLMPYAGKERHQGGVPFSKKPRPQKERKK